MGLRQVLVVALAGWAGWLLFRGVVRRRVPWIGVAALAVPLLLLGWTERQWVSAEREFSAASRAVAPDGPGVHCQRLGETFTYAGAELGHVMFDDRGRPDGPAMVSYESCQHLTAFLHADDAAKRAAPLAQLIAVHVLTHEAVHMTGVLDESDTECQAMQRDVDVAAALGASPATARAHASRYAAQVYPRMPSEYRATQCHEGGSLDETPDDGVWP
jgi:hypothetical protein